MSDLLYWIWFASRRGVRSSSKQRLLELAGSPRDIFLAGEKGLQGLGLREEETASLLDGDTDGARRILERCEEENVQILSIQDSVYPERLRNIPDPPYVLYVKGRFPSVDEEAAVTVVGTRSSSPYGDKMARNMGYGLAKSGALVVTGLAGGIDSRAAEGALMAGGRVLGVLGTGICEIYPRYNRELFEDVAVSGAIISEYPPDAVMNRLNFPARNRIMAALSLGTVVIEAPAGSGALITAARALEYGRDVFAVPGNADAPNSRGGNALIKEGARLVENAWDVLSEYELLYADKLKGGGQLEVPAGMQIPQKTAAAEKSAVKKSVPDAEKGFFKFRVPVRRKTQEQSAGAGNENGLEAQLAGLSESQLKIIAAITKPSEHIDDIIDNSQLQASEVLSELTLLQIKGLVTQERGKRFTLNIKKRG